MNTQRRPSLRAAFSLSSNSGPVLLRGRPSFIPASRTPSSKATLGGFRGCGQGADAYKWVRREGWGAVINLKAPCPGCFGSTSAWWLVAEGRAIVLRRLGEQLQGLRGAQRGRASPCGRPGWTPTTGPGSQRVLPRSQMLPLEKIASQFEILVLWSLLEEDEEERFKVVVWKCQRLLASISAYYTVSCQGQSSWCFHFFLQPSNSAQPFQALPGGRERRVGREPSAACFFPDPLPQPAPLPLGWSVSSFFPVGLFFQRLVTKELSSAECCALPFCTCNPNAHFLSFRYLKLAFQGPAVLQSWSPGPALPAVWIQHNWVRSHFSHPWNGKNHSLKNIAFFFFSNFKNMKQWNTDVNKCACWMRGNGGETKPQSCLIT